MTSLPDMRRLRSSPLLRNILAVASGAAAGQAVTFAFSPLITRIYSPEVFGLQGVFLSLISILSPVIALRYPMAIITAENEADAGRMARLSLVVAFIVSCLLGLVLLVAQGPVLRMVGAEALGALIWLLPLALFCVALQDVADFRAARAHQFRLVGLVTVAQAFLTNLARVLGGLVAPVAGMLVAVTSIAPSVQAALLTIGNRRPRPPRPALTRADAIELLRNHKDFPLYRVPTDVLNAASQSVPVILLAALFTPAAAGLYVLTRSVLNLPSNIIGAAVGNVLYARFAELSRSGRPLMPLLLRSTAALFALAPFIIGLAWFAPAVFALVFGEEWREAGYYAQWMSLWIAMMIANVAMVRAIPIIQRQGLYLIYNVALLIARILAVAVAAHFSEHAHTAVASFSITSAIMIIFGNLMFMKCVYTFDQKKGKTRCLSAKP